MEVTVMTYKSFNVCTWMCVCVPFRSPHSEWLTFSICCLHPDSVYGLITVHTELYIYCNWSIVAMDVRKCAVVRIIISVYYVTAEIVNLKPFLCLPFLCLIGISVQYLSALKVVRTLSICCATVMQAWSCTWNIKFTLTGKVLLCACLLMHALVE